MSLPESASFDDPIALALGVAEKNGWEHLQFEDSSGTVSVPGLYDDILVTLRWSELADMLLVRIILPLPNPVPEFAMAELCILLNLMNGRSLGGSWYYDYDLQDEGSESCIVWRNEVHTDLSNMPNDEQIERIIIHAKWMHDTFYPVLMSFLSAKPVYVAFDGGLNFERLGMLPEEAIEFLDDSRVVGRA